MARCGLPVPRTTPATDPSRGLPQTAASTATVGQSMQTAGKAMAAMGAKNTPQQMMQNLQQFR